MKLSEAILLGSTLSPQAFGTYEDRHGNRCALGCALAAAGVVDIHRDSPRERLASLWPQLDDYFSGSCPECPKSSHVAKMIPTVGDISTHLNDKHLWTRERTAEWAAQFEPEDKQTDVEQGPVADSLEVQSVEDEDAVEYDA